jgi:hypothetical protein
MKTENRTNGLECTEAFDMNSEGLLKLDNGQIVPPLPGFRWTCMPEIRNPGILVTDCDGIDHRTLDLLLKQLEH